MNGNIKLTTSRRAIVGLLRYSRHIPTIPVARRMSLGSLGEARARLESPPSWSAMFIRAYGLVCERFEQLRRAWISWPSPHLYQHPCSSCAVAVERVWEGEAALFCGRIESPESATLEKVQQHLRKYQEADIRSISSFRLTLRFGRLPTLLQRLFMWLRLDWSGARRVKDIGTFGMTNYGMLDAESLHPLGPQTTVLTLGPMQPNGEITVKLVYDHRVLDGAYVARALAHLEEVLQTTILDELKRASTGQHGQDSSLRRTA
jgi:hypothetical protein